MTARGVILYGPPASGKDAVTTALVRAHHAFRHYPRLKVGSGHVDGYEMITEGRANELRRRGDVVFENRRYGNRYIVDRPRLRAMFEAGSIPVVHLGQVLGVRTVVASMPARWLTVLLWCSRETSGDRAAARGTADVMSRLVAWDETYRELREHGCGDFAVVIDTEQHRPEDAARVIRQRTAALRGASERP